MNMCVCASIPFGFESGVWDLIVLIPYHCLFYFLFLYLFIQDYVSNGIYVTDSKNFYAQAEIDRGPLNLSRTLYHVVFKACIARQFKYMIYLTYTL